MVNRMSVALMVLLAMMFLGPVPAGASVAPTIDGPALVTRTATAVITGHAEANGQVQIYFHRNGEPAGHYTVRRHLIADRAGNFRTSYLADVDHAYYAESAGLTSRVVVSRVKWLTVGGPSSAKTGATVTISGRSVPGGSLVTVYFHKYGQPAGYFSARRSLRSSPGGLWHTSYVANTDYRYYATSNGLRSANVLTTISKSVTPYVFPVRPVGGVGYARTHHDYPATDIFTTCGSDVVAVTDGVVQETSSIDRWNPAVDDPATRGGLFVSLVGADGVRYYQAHLHDLVPGMRPGTRVRAGELIAHAGETGNARGLGCHVHFGISPPCGPGEWSIRRGVLYPWPYLDSWRAGGRLSPVAAVRSWRIAHVQECARHRLAGT